MQQGPKQPEGLTLFFVEGVEKPSLKDAVKKEKDTNQDRETESLEDC